jgi:hypothetical protein
MAKIFPNPGTMFKAGNKANPNGRPRGTKGRKLATSNLTFDQARLNLAEEYREGFSVKCELDQNGLHRWIIKAGKARVTGETIRDALDKLAEKLRVKLALGEKKEFKALMYRRTEDDYKKRNAKKS